MDQFHWECKARAAGAERAPPFDMAFGVACAATPNHLNAAVLHAIFAMSFQIRATVSH